MFISRGICKVEALTRLLYQRDVDLGWRLWIHGYRILRSDSIVFHKGALQADATR
jgi:GT2 family glycosyltransferase